MSWQGEIVNLHRSQPKSWELFSDPISDNIWQPPHENKMWHGQFNFGFDKNSAEDVKQILFSHQCLKTGVWNINPWLKCWFIRKYYRHLNGFRYVLISISLYSLSLFFASTYQGLSLILFHSLHVYLILFIPISFLSSVSHSIHAILIPFMPFSFLSWQYHFFYANILFSCQSYSLHAYLILLMPTSFLLCVSNSIHVYCCMCISHYIYKDVIGGVFVVKAMDCGIVGLVWFGLFGFIIFTNPSAQAGYDTRSIFKRSLTGLNSEFSFS